MHETNLVKRLVSHLKIPCFQGFSAIYLIYEIPVAHLKSEDVTLGSRTTTSGPHTPDEIRKIYAGLGRQFPNDKISLPI